jgi:YD repeat-containing protein
LFAHEPAVQRRLEQPPLLSATQDTNGWQWYHTYVVTDITDSDGVGGGPDELTHYDYSTTASSDPSLWAFDQQILQADVNKRSWNVWRGYATVTTTHGTTGGPLQVTEDLYYRGMNGDRSPTGGWTTPKTVNIIDGSGTYTDSYPLAGTLRESTIFNGPIAGDRSNWVHQTYHTPAITVTGSQSLPAPNPPMSASRSSEVTTTGISRSSVGDRWTNVATTYDTYGRPTFVKDEGDYYGGTSDDRCTTTTYATDTIRWFMSFPAQTLTTTCAVSPAAADYLAGSQNFYDGSATLGAIPGTGDITKTTGLVKSTSAPPSGTDWIQSSRATFDTYGRIVDTFDALDRKTTTHVHPGDRIGNPGPVTSMTVTNPLNWTTTTYFDPLRGQPTKVLDVNGKKTEAQYDTAGRLSAVWKDNRATTGTPDIAYTYLLRDSATSYIQTKVLGPDGQQIQSYQLFDGRLRARQSWQSLRRVPAASSPIPNTTPTALSRKPRRSTTPTISPATTAAQSPSPTRMWPTSSATPTTTSAAAPPRSNGPATAPPAPNCSRPSTPTTATSPHRSPHRPAAPPPPPSATPAAKPSSYANTRPPRPPVPTTRPPTATTGSAT